MHTEQGVRVVDYLAQTSIDRFTALPLEVRRGDKRPLRDGGIVVAAILKQGQEQGSDERFQELHQQLASDPDYRAGVLVETMNYCEPDMLPTVFDAIDTIDPESLPLEKRLEVMTALSKALPYQPGEQPIRGAWSSYIVSAKWLFSRVTQPDMLWSGTIENLFYVGRFTDIQSPEEYVTYLVDTISPCLERRLFVERYPEESDSNLRHHVGVASGTLKALSILGSAEQHQQLVDILTDSTDYTPTVARHIESLLDNDNTAGLGFYNNLRGIFSQVPKMNGLDTAYAGYLVRNGDIEAALTNIAELSDYTKRLDSMLLATEVLAASGDLSRAAEIIQQAADLDPAPLGMDYGPAPVGNGNYEGVAYLQDAQTDRGYGLEKVADSAAQIGLFDQALEAYAGSHKSAGLMERYMAESAVKLGRMDEYVRAVLACETLDDFSKAPVLLAAVTAFYERDSRFTDGNSSSMQIEIETLVQAFARERLDKTELASWLRQHQFSPPPPLLQLLGRSGAYNEALALLEDSDQTDVRQVMGTLGIVYEAYRGRTAEALSLYEDAPDSPRLASSAAGPDQRRTALTAININSLLVGDEVSMRKILERYSASDQHQLMHEPVRHAGEAIVRVSPEILEIALATDYYPESMLVERTASFIKRAGIVKRHLNL